MADTSEPAKPAGPGPVERFDALRAGGSSLHRITGGQEVPGVRGWLRIASYVAASGALAIALLVLIAWSTGLGPDQGWGLPSPNGALAVGTIAVVLLGVNAGLSWVRVLVAVPLLLATSALVAHARGASAIETWFPGQPDEGVISVQSASTVIVLSAAIALAALPNPTARRVTTALGAVLVAALALLGSGVIAGVGDLVDPADSLIASLPAALGTALAITAFLAGELAANRWPGVIATGLAGGTLRLFVLAAGGLIIVDGVLVSVLLASTTMRAESVLLVTIVVFTVGLSGIGAAVHARMARQEALIDRIAGQDPDTGLWNRMAFHQLAARAMSDARRRRAPIGIIVIDVDGLKEVNDTLGHPEGTALIALVGHAIARGVRAGDLAARVGGDEFAVIGPLDEHTAAEIVQRIRHLAWSRAESEHRPWVPEISGGWAVAEREDATVEELFARADARMYAAKQARGAARRRARLGQYVVSRRRSTPR